MPLAPSQKPVAGGGWLASDMQAGIIYAAKGNKTGDFYSFKPRDSTWTFLAAIPAGDDGRMPYHGARGVHDNAGSVYATTGNNTTNFWRYDVDSNAWHPLAPVPLGRNGRRVKGGTDVAFVTEQKIGYVYLLKGGTTDFMRFNTASGVWDTTLPSAPAGQRAKWDKGSWLVAVGDSVIYAHKAKYQELWPYNVAARQWSTSPLPGMPLASFTGRSRKSKDGGCAAWHVSRLYALKGSNTQEAWCFNPGENVWRERETIPVLGTTGKRKKVKSGADIVGLEVAGAPWALVVLKGNRSLELWRYQAFYALRNDASGRTPSSAERAPAVIDWPLGTTGIQHGRLRLRGPTADRLYEATGRAVPDVGYLRAGVYLVLPSPGGPARKLVIVR